MTWPREVFDDHFGCALQGQVVPDGHYHLDRTPGSASGTARKVGYCGSPTGRSGPTR
ncbi:MAG TPA: hypothetical protein VF044_02305 [Actinomycetota bacterium]